MNRNRCNASFRLHVDAALPSFYEELFSVADLLAVEAASSKADPERTAQLRIVVAEGLSALGSLSGSSPGPRPIGERSGATHVGTDQ